MKKTIFMVNSQIKSLIQSFNNQLKNAYKNLNKDDNENHYLVLLNEDLAKNLKDKNKFIDDYLNFAENYNLPYTFYPYYGNFNKVMLQISPGIPHPFFNITFEKRNNEKINIVHQIAPGCLVLNINKLKSINFKFDTTYPSLFYLQDLVEKCYRAKLWISNCWYFDRFESWKDIKENTLDVLFPINQKNFQDEQKRYFEINKDCKYKDPNQIIEDIKKWINGEEIPVETSQTVQVAVKNAENISLTVPQEMVKKDIVLNVNSLSTTAPSSTEQESQNKLSAENVIINTDEEALKSFTNNEKVQEIAKLARMIDQNTKKETH